MNHFFALVLTVVVGVLVTFFVGLGIELYQNVRSPDLPDTIGTDLFFAISILVVPQVVMVLLAKHKPYAAFVGVFIAMFSVIITFAQFVSMLYTSFVDPAEIEVFVALPLTWVLPIILLSVAPAKAVTRRLIFLALGLLLLIGLNELSKLGLDVTAPKLRG